MKYMLLIYHEEQGWESISEAEREQIYGEYRALRGELESRGQFLDGSELQPVATATAVRVRDGKELITDGPFAETHEQLGDLGCRETAECAQRECDLCVTTQRRVATRKYQAQPVIWIFHDFVKLRRFGKWVETRLFVFEFWLLVSARLVAPDGVEQLSLRNGG